MNQRLSFYRSMAMLGALCLLASANQVSAQFGPEDEFIGQYEGEYIPTGRDPWPATADVIAQGEGLYRIMLQTQTPEPDSQVWPIELFGKQYGPKVVFWGNSYGALWNGEITDGILSFASPTQGYGSKFSLQKVERDSPAAGMEPPDNAIVLLPFKPGQAPDISAWVNDKWKTTEEGTMYVHGGDNKTKQSFSDMRLHVEFKLPHVPWTSGQGRANSGVYIMDRFEVQVLDSFGTLASAGDCGSIYGVAAPRVNASLPPLRWQTFDIEYRAPRLDDAKTTMTQPALLTVYHNGIMIHEDQELWNQTGGGPKELAEEGPVRLQDHGHAVQFRNIWLTPLEED